MHERKVDDGCVGPDVHDLVPDTGVEVAVVPLAEVVVVAGQAAVVFEGVGGVEHAEVEACACFAGLVCALSQGADHNVGSQDGVNVEADGECGGGILGSYVVTIVREEVVVCKGV